MGEGHQARVMLLQASKLSVILHWRVPQVASLPGHGLGPTHSGVNGSVWPLGLRASY